jgi:hypothetical protein
LDTLVFRREGGRDVHQKRDEARAKPFRIAHAASISSNVMGGMPNLAPIISHFNGKIKSYMWESEQMPRNRYL